MNDLATRGVTVGILFHLLVRVNEELNRVFVVVTSLTVFSTDVGRGEVLTSRVDLTVLERVTVNGPSLVVESLAETILRLLGLRTDLDGRLATVIG